LSFAGLEREAARRADCDIRASSYSPCSPEHHRLMARCELTLSLRGRKLCASRVAIAGRGERAGALLVRVDRRR